MHIPELAICIIAALSSVNDATELLFTHASCTCYMVSEPAPKCLLCCILCAWIVVIHTESIYILLERCEQQNIWQVF